MRRDTRYRGARWRRQPMLLAGIALSASSLALNGIAPELSVALLALLLTGALLRCLLQDRWIADLAVRIGADPKLPLKRALIGRCLALVEVDRATAGRLAQRHGVSGLPTRELLITAMRGSDGMLGIVEFADYDRLCASDPDRADRVLNIIAGRIMRMAGPDRMVAHVDRARFAIWFDAAMDSSPHTSFDAIAYALQDRVTIDDEPLLPVVRLGHIDCTAGEATPDRLLARAFAVLATRRPGAGLSLEAASVAIRCDFAIEQDLRRAIGSGEFELWFQPFIDARRAVVCGAEALIRWRHPVRGLISPAEFVPVAEAAGLAGVLGTWVLDTACRAASGWTAAGLSQVKVAVNISGHQIEEPGLFPLVQRTVARHALDPGLLELELTETVAAVDGRATADQLARLRSFGTAISIDDFGTGYSSLSYLKNLSFDKLKIDREFVTDVDRRQDSQAICKSVIALARGLGIAVLAEGVERPEEMAWLRTEGCHLFQGYYFARPLPEGEFLHFARDRRLLARLLDPAPTKIMKRMAG